MKLDTQTMTGSAMTLVAAAAVGVLTWRREFGEIVAGAVLMASAALLGFCLVMYLKYEVGADTTRKNRMFYKVGHVVFWIAVAVIPCVLGWIVASRLGALVL